MQIRRFNERMSKKKQSNDKRRASRLRNEDPRGYERAGELQLITEIKVKAVTDIRER